MCNLYTHIMTSAKTYILYDGVGAKKSGKHTVAEFLKIMNREYNVQCSEYLTDLEYGPCIEREKINVKTRAKMMKNPNYKMSAKTRRRHTRLVNQCMKYKASYKNRACNLDDYIKFSGAEKQV